MEIQRDIKLSDHTTFKTGGPARFFCVAHTEQDVVDAIQYAEQQQIPVYILGGGSNVLVSEKGYNGLVIKIATQGIAVEEQGSQVYVEAQAGVHWDECVRLAVEQGLYGIENLSWIPGTVGAAPIQNIGAYGVEVSQVIESVKVYNTENKSFEILRAEACLFGYRDSVFKTAQGKKYIITRVTFVLSQKGLLNKNYADIVEYEKEHGAIETLAHMRQAIIAIRTRKLPDLHTYGTAGSFFKNPVISQEEYTRVAHIFPSIPVYPSGKDGFVKVSAGFLIDKGANMRGVRIKDVGTYANQALVLVNYGNATSDEIRAFAEEIITKVKAISGITLEMEVQEVGN